MVDPIGAAVKAARIFESVGIPYVLGGSLASSVRGEPRFTVDVDFAVHLESSKVKALVAACAGKFLINEESVREAAAAPQMFNMVHLPDYVKVDVHVVAKSGLNKSEIERARWSRLSKSSSEEVLVATAEDIILQKLRWFDLGGRTSERQWRDVLGVMKARRNALDMGYLKRWSVENGTNDLLERALAGSQDPPDAGHEKIQSE